MKLNRKQFGMVWATVVCLAVMLAPLFGGGRPTYTTADSAAVIPDATGVFTACQTILVPTVPAEDINGADVNVSVAAAHSWVGDLTYRLAPPSGTSLTLLNRPGRLGAGFGNDDNLVIGTPVVFDDAAPSAVLAEDMGDGCAGTIGVTAGCPDNYIPSPDAADTPIPGVGTNLAQWTGLTNVVGTWTLCVADSGAGDTGTLSSWSITFVGTTPVELLGVSVD